MSEPPRDSSIEHLHPVLAFKIGRLLEYMLIDHQQLKVIETARSLERQEWLYAQGRTRPGPIVTNAPPGTSHHTPDKRGLSHACDLAWHGDKPFDGDHPWETLGMAGEMLGLKWGGRFPIRDYGHFEL